MKNQWFNLSFWLFAIFFVTAWALVALDVQAGERSTIGTVAGAWLGLQAIGLALSKLGIGIPEHEFWRTCADSHDGGIDDIPNRRVAWFVHGILDHFSLIKYPKGVQASAAKIKLERK